MKMQPQSRALDKLYKRRDRYDIPDWQRGRVWNTAKQQQLIDTILRGWRLPKFYFVKVGNEQFEVVDGQQRLNAIFRFFDNELPLTEESAALFGGQYYRDLTSEFSDAFDDFEIDYDEISDTAEPTLKEFFQRLQKGLPLTSSERLNAEHSKLRDYCKTLAKHKFFTTSIAVPDTRFAHLDIISKVITIEMEGLNAGLRYDDIKPVFEANSNFSTTSALAKRVRLALDFLAVAFPAKDASLKNRTIVQSVLTLACRLVGTGQAKNLEVEFAQFIRTFMAKLSHQIDLGQAATDLDLLRFQKSVNANVKAGAKTRHEILLRRAFQHHPKLANAFSPDMLKESGISAKISEIADSIIHHTHRLNTAHSAIHGKDLFKATNKTAHAHAAIRKPVSSLSDYRDFIAHLYFLFWEAPGDRLGEQPPQSFADVNALRTDLEHDVDHGKTSKVKSKRVKIGATFRKFGGISSPEALDPNRFIVIQANILAALEQDLAALSISR